MLKKTILLLILAGILCWVKPAQAFDPGGWIKQGILKLDGRASEQAIRGTGMRSTSAGKQGDTIRRIKKYFKNGSGAAGKRRG